MQSPCTLRETETKKGRCSVSDNGPLTFPRQLDVVADSAFVARTLDAELLFRKCWEKIGTHRAQPDFQQQNRRSLMPKTGVWSTDLSFSPHFRNRSTEVCGKFRDSRAHRPLHVKKQQVEALPLSGVVGMSRIYRILPIGRSFSTLVAPTSSENVLKTALKSPWLALTAYNTHV